MDSEYPPVANLSHWRDSTGAGEKGEREVIYRGVMDEAGHPIALTMLLSFD